MTQSAQPPQSAQSLQSAQSPQSAQRSRPAGRARTRPAFRCSTCGHTTAKWVGRCADCGTWGAVEEVPAVSTRTVAATVPHRAAVPISSVPAGRFRRRPSGVAELDRVLGGGVVPGSVTLLAGDPGVGKSTLLLQTAQHWADSGGRVLYVSAEESTGQIRLRADRIGCDHDRIYLAAESDLSAVLGHIDAVRPTLAVVDSVQTVCAGDTEGVPGGVTQVRAVIAALTAAVKVADIALIVVGHVTKDGAVAGPRSLEHLVDAVLHFEGDPGAALRTVRAVKNRFGSTDEVGCFLMGEAGVEEVPDPSGLFLEQRDRSVPGTAITVALDGRRPLIGEVQALLAPSSGGAARRAVSGIDPARTAMIAAVLDKHAGIATADRELYLSTVGGMRLTDPSTDLAVAAALMSADSDLALPSRTVVIGEVGLAGDLRPVAGIDRRLAEAARLGFTDALVPPGKSGAVPSADGMRIVQASDIGSALHALAGAAQPRGPRIQLLDG